MKKLLVMATVLVAGMVSANEKLPVKKNILTKDLISKSQNSKEIPPLLPMRDCKWVSSSCGEGGLKCSDSDEPLHQEEIIEFQYLLEDVFCGGCFIDC
jgi:hypothetical protein